MRVSEIKIKLFFYNYKIIYSFKFTNIEININLNVVKKDFNMFNRIDSSRYILRTDVHSI